MSTSGDHKTAFRTLIMTIYYVLTCTLPIDLLIVIVNIVMLLHAFLCSVSMI